MEHAESSVNEYRNWIVSMQTSASLLVNTSTLKYKTYIGIISKFLYFWWRIRFIKYKSKKSEWSEPLRRENNNAYWLILHKH